MNENLVTKKRQTSLRTRIEQKITIYGPDRRKKAATLKRVVYSDGRRFKSTQLHHGLRPSQLQDLLRDHFHFPELDSIKLSPSRLLPSLGTANKKIRALKSKGFTEAQIGRWVRAGKIKI